MSNAAVAAIQFAQTLDDFDMRDFLQMWNHGEFPEIREQWPQVPQTVFDGVEVTPDFIMLLEAYALLDKKEINPDLIFVNKADAQWWKDNEAEASGFDLRKVEITVINDD